MQKPQYPGQLLDNQKMTTKLKKSGYMVHKKSHHKLMCKKCKGMHKTEDHEKHYKHEKHEKKHKMPKTYKGKSTKLGHGGRAAKLRDQLTAKHLPKSEIGGIIGKIARSKGAAPGQKNYHGHK